VILKATLALLLALGAAALFRRAAAATRHTILMAGQIAALAVPLLAYVVPHVDVEYAPVQLTPRAVAGHATPSAAPAPLPARSARSVNWLPVVWMLGFAAVATKRGVSYARAFALARSGAPASRRLARRRPAPPPRGAETAPGQPARTPALHHDVERYDVEHCDVDQPVTIGSRILLPREAANWPAPRLRAVLLHEHAHVQRRDFLHAFISDVTCAVYWFHPLAWLAARQAALAREQACDDAVLAHGVEPDAYAAAILDVARTLVRRRTAPALAMAQRSQLEVRLRAILDDTRIHHATKSARFAVVIAAIACAPLIAALTPRGNEPDLRGDTFASPFSEHISFDTIPNVPAAGPDAALIATMHQLARQPRHSEIDFVADRARWALGRVENGELLAPLIASLHDSDWRIRAYAAWGLAVAGDARATPALVPLMDERIWRVRAMTASALASIADPAAAPAMKRALADEAWQVRSEAVRYFHAIGADRTLFQGMLDDRHILVRTKAQEALQ
jgi:BlaR1 peptidase M56/HEAT repeats